jgi:type IV pilus assembly protein PilM
MRRKKGRPLLGIDIGPTAITVVEASGTWPKPEIRRIESAPTPVGAIDSGQLVDVDAICNVLRVVIDKLGSKTREAVMGLPAQFVTTRVLDIPTVPASEMAAVIEGEVVHQKIMREPGASFDFIPLQPAGTTSTPNTQVLVMAAEENAISYYRVIAERVGLKLISLEPALSAMFRAASPDVYSHPACLCVTIDATASEISIVDDGKLRLYRRVDTGSDSLLGKSGTRRLETPSRTRPLPPARGGLARFSNDEDEDDTDDTPEPAGLDGVAASALALEIQRSIDYYRREYPEAARIDTLVAATSVPGLHGFVAWLQNGLGIETRAAQIDSASIGSTSLRTQVTPPEGLQYIRAYGLAMRELANVPATVPRLDLLGQQQVERAEAIAQRKLLLAGAAAAAILCYCIFTSITVGMHVRSIARDLEASKNDLKNLQQIKAVRIDQLEKQKDLLTRLKLDGLPLPRVTDAVAVTVPAHVGLTDIAVSKVGMVSIAGEAGNDRMLISMLEGLKSSPLLENTSLDSFDSSNQNAARPGLVHFQITSQLIGIKHSKPAAQAAPKPS